MHDITDYILNSSCLTRRLTLGVPNGIEKFPRLIQQKVTFPLGWSFDKCESQMIVECFGSDWRLDEMGGRMQIESETNLT